MRLTKVRGGATSSLEAAIKPNVNSAAEAARQKDCTRQTIYNAIDRGDLTGVRLGTSRLVALDEKYEQYEVKETGGRLHRSYREKQEEG